MLKQAFTVQSQTLQFVLGAVSSNVAFNYGYQCAAMVFDLSCGMFQLGVIGFIFYSTNVMLAIVILLALQLRCLFGTGGAVASVAVDGMYRALHAADTFSIYCSTQLGIWNQFLNVNYCYWLDCELCVMCVFECTCQTCVNV